MVMESKFSLFVLAALMGTLYSFFAGYFEVFDHSHFTILCGVVSTLVGVIYHWDKVVDKKTKVAFALGSMFIPILLLKLLLFFWDWLFPVASILSFGFGLYSFKAISTIMERTGPTMDRLHEAGLKRLESLIGGKKNDGQ